MLKPNEERDAAHVSSISIWNHLSMRLDPWITTAGVSSIAMFRSSSFVRWLVLVSTRHHRPIHGYREESADNLQVKTTSVGELPKAGA